MGAGKIAPAEVGGLWVPANPEHAKLGWSYDFEQTERIARAAYDSTGYDATMEVVEFVMAEADRRHRAALVAKDAELALETAKCEFWRKADATSQSQLAEARKALEPFAVIASRFSDETSRRLKPDDHNVWGYGDETLTYGDFRRARALLGGSENAGN